MQRVTFSRNYTLSLSRTCQCFCKYCAFATHRAHIHEPAEVERRLDEAVRNGEFDDGRLPAIFDDLQHLFTQSHHVRALGVYLLDAAAVRGRLAGVKRTLAVVPAGSKADTIVIGPPA